MVTAVCFDLDGTLYDDRQYIRAGFEQAARLLEAETGENLYDEFLTAFFEQGIRDRCFDHVLERHGLSTEYVPELVDAYHDNTAVLDPYPSACPVLDELDSEYDLAVITDGKNGRSKLRRLGLSHYFDEILVTATNSISKRNQRPFHDALRVLSADPENAVYVGDRPEIDFPQPNSIGMSTVRILRGVFKNADTTGRTEPDETIETLEELPAVIDSLE